MSTSTERSGISLLDLGNQFPFEIDDKLKAELTFAETLIVSCAHYDGKVAGEDGGEGGADGGAGEFRDEIYGESSWTCTATPSTPVPQEPAPFEIVDHVIEEPEPEELSDDEGDFHFYFFPDCKKPPPSKDSKQSVIMVDGMPKINPILKSDKHICLCQKDKKGACHCFTELPCKCGAKTKSECICKNLREICICNEDKPNPVCVCHKDPRVCTCFPGPPQPICVCDDVVKPCICRKGKFPSPVCECKFKPSYKPKLPATSVSLGAVEEWDGQELSLTVHTSVTSAPQGEGSEESGMVVGGMSKGEITGAAKSEGGMPGAARSEGGIARGAKSEGGMTEGATSEGGLGVMDEYEDEYAYDMELINRLNSAKLTASDYKKLKDVEEEEPCVCQVPPPKEHCLCHKGKECTCLENACICGVQKTCVCSSEGTIDQICKSEAASDKIVCHCPIPRVCSCELRGVECKCFPKKRYCTCGDPENCKCNKVCDCTEPCICDTQPPKIDECLCPEKKLVCTCPWINKDANKIKRIRAGKEGYRWCRDVDPYHTFFDYAYGRYDLIDYKEQEKEKFKILGLYDQKEEVCPIHGTELPHFQKKVRKPSLDCCSSVGGITISVETLGELQDKFLVQVVSHASKEGAKTGSKLVSILDVNLHTLEENRTEYITKRSLTKQRKSYMAICDNGYYNKVTRICGEKHATKRLYHTFDQSKNFLLEGANVVLLRYFGLRRYKGVVTTETVLMDGTICESIYVCLGVSQAVVNGKPLFVNKVERHIIEPSGALHQTLTVLSLRGYIISHEWADNSYVLHINPLLNVIPTKDLIEDHAPLRDRWREDLQLFSDYLDFKARRTQEGARYVSESGLLTATVRDYLQAILMLKPQDVVHFTRHYFDSALSSMDLPRDEYFDSCPKHVRYFYLEE